MMMVSTGFILLMYKILQNDTERVWNEVDTLMHLDKQFKHRTNELLCLNEPQKFYDGQILTEGL